MRSSLGSLILGMSSEYHVELNRRYCHPDLTEYNHRSIMNSSYIDELEERLAEFTSDWEAVLKKRVLLWRVRLLIGFVLSLVVPLLFPNLSWLWLVVMGMSAGSLFSLFKSNLNMQKHVNACREHIRNARIYENCSR